jgi:hypothetical protein
LGILIIFSSGLLADAFLEHTYNEVPVPKPSMLFAAAELSDIHFQWSRRHSSASSKILKASNQTFFRDGGLVSRDRTNSISEFDAKTVAHLSVL